MKTRNNVKNTTRDGWTASEQVGGGGGQLYM